MFLRVNTMYKKFSAGFATTSRPRLPIYVIDLGYWWALREKSLSVPKISNDMSYSSNFFRVLFCRIVICSINSSHVGAEP